MHVVYVRKKKRKIDECDCGGCIGAPMSNVANTVGVGNVVPASMAAMTGAEQCSPDCIGSGDNFGGFQNRPKKKIRKRYTKKSKKK